jgi:hypothetical protein
MVESVKGEHMHADREWSLERVQPIEPSLLKRREIEARIAVPLIQAFAEKMEREQALAMATKVIQALACAAGREMAKKLGVNDMVAFTRVIRGVWAQDKALEMTMLEETDLKLSFDVTRCAYAELYEKLGMKEFGRSLSCSRDAGFAEGFNPRLKLQRTQTIMEGSPHCDFRFSLE